jgi:hypothetical protein
MDILPGHQVRYLLIANRSTLLIVFYPQFQNILLVRIRPDLWTPLQIPSVQLRIGREYLFQRPSSLTFRFFAYRAVAFWAMGHG